MKKKLPVVPARVREEEAARLAGLSLQPALALAELQGAIRDGLMAFSCATGLLVIAEMMEADGDSRPEGQARSRADSRA